MKLKHPFAITIVTKDTPNALNGSTFEAKKEWLEVINEGNSKEIAYSIEGLRKQKVKTFVSPESIIQSALMQMCPNIPLSHLYFTITIKEENENN